MTIKKKKKTSQKCWEVVQKIMYSILTRRNIYVDTYVARVKNLCFNCQHHHIKEKLLFRYSKQRRGCTILTKKKKRKKKRGCASEQPLIFVFCFVVVVIYYFFFLGLFVTIFVQASETE